MYDFFSFLVELIASKKDAFDSFVLQILINQTLIPYYEKTTEGSISVYRFRLIAIQQVLKLCYTGLLLFILYIIV